MPNSKTGRCCICGLPAKISRIAEDCANHYDCPRCGRYFVEDLGPFGAAPVESYYTTARAAVSYYVRELNRTVPEPKLSKELKAEALRRLPVPTGEILKNLLLYIGGVGRERGVSASWEFDPKKMTEEYCSMVRMPAFDDANLYRVREDGFWRNMLAFMHLSVAAHPDDAAYYIESWLGQHLGYVELKPRTSSDPPAIRLAPKGRSYLEGLSGGESKEVFIAMWFDRSTEKLREAIRGVVHGCGYEPFFVDEVYRNSANLATPSEELRRNESVANLMLGGIRRAKFVITDLSCMPGEKHESQGYKDKDGNPLKRDIVCAGAYFEAGFASALNKPVIYTTHEKQQPHFDVSHIMYIKWSEEDVATDRFKYELELTIKARIP